MTFRYSATIILLTALSANQTRAGSYFPTNSSDETRIVHPHGYSGTGGVIVVRVCIDPASLFAREMELPLQKAIASWNALTPTTNTYITNSMEVPATHADFESTAVHEIGHCLGLGHTNLTPFGFFTTFTISTAGPDGVFSLNPGADGTQGSRDDVREDDTNKSWFRKSDNNPFTPDPPGSSVDLITYSRLLISLPTGDNYPANANPALSMDLGFGSTEAVMQSNTFLGTENRLLVQEDVVTLKYAMSGLDELSGTGDDYTIQVVFEEELSPDCEIVAKFVPSLPVADAIAACSANWTMIGASHHYQMTTAELLFLSEQPFFFSQGPDLVITKSDGDIVAAVGDTIVYVLAVSNVGTNPASGVVIEEFVPLGTVFNVPMSDPAWNCQDVIGGSTCTLAVGAVPSGAPPGVFNYAVTVISLAGTGVTRISNFTTVSDDGVNGPDENYMNNEVLEETPLLGPDLAVVKDDGGASVRAGETVVYTLTVSNIGTQDADGAVLFDTIPPDTMFEAAQSSPEWVCPAVTPGALCELAIGDIMAGAPPVDYLFALTVDSDIDPSVEMISNIGVIADTGANGPDEDPANNNDRDDTPLVPATLIFASGFETGTVDDWTLSVMTLVD